MKPLTQSHSSISLNNSVKHTTSLANPSRRTLLRSAGLLGVAAATTPLLSACGSGNGDKDDAITIGGMWLLSGSLSTYGKFAREGAKLAEKEINDADGVLGRPIKVLFEDEGDADSILQVARKLTYDKDADFLMGLDSSGTAQALAPNMPDLDRVLMLTHAASGELTGESCNRYTFRCSVNIPQLTYAGSQVALREHSDVNTWTTIGPDYAFGHEIWELFPHFLKEAGHDAKFAKPIYAPLENEDFSSHITQALDSNADGVLVTVWGADLVNFIRQAKPRGFFDKKTVMFQLGAAVEVLDALGDEMPTGIWAGTRYWWDSPDTKTNDDFVKKYEDTYGHKPSYNAQGAYNGVHLLAMAADKADSTNSDDVIDALEGIEFDAPQGKTVIRPEDHQAIADVPWGKLTKSESGMRALEPLNVVPGDEATRPVAEIACEMK